MRRRRFILQAACAAAAAARPARAEITLPQNLCFTAGGRFATVLKKAHQAGWAALPMGERVAAVGRELEGVPYRGFTLEIHDSIECPSCHFGGLDCWTFFETAFGLARLVEQPASAHTWRGLLGEIEWTRYRGGRCSGQYLERIHYLDEWFYDNAARGNVEHLTPVLPGAIPLRGRKSTEMTDLWRSYRYLRENPALRPAMRRWEERVESLPVTFVPKAAVAAVEAQHLRTGDIIGIVTDKHGTVCSHVGLAVRDGRGALRFLHASQKHKKVVLDAPLHAYLGAFTHHMGIMAARPLPASQSVRDPAAYARRLKALAGLAPGL